MEKVIDIKEDTLYELSPTILTILLKDHSSNANIIWATDNYENLGQGYRLKDSISIYSITERNNMVIRPRVSKTKEEQTLRVRNNAEVFTPSWVCNEQNNLIDDAWFGGKTPFNTSKDKFWEVNKEPISFENVEGKTWKDYILDTRLEITCGEAPYLTSRYDTVSGKYINPNERIGLLDRKLRVVGENTNSKEEWLVWAKKSLENVYGFEFQGDSLLIARENVLLTVLEHYEDKYDDTLSIESIIEMADIASWNLWQMDGLKYVIPYSCHNEDIIEYTLFGEEVTHQECIGCVRNAVTKHNGIYCKIKDWEKGKTIKYVNLVTRGHRA